MARIFLVTLVFSIFIFISSASRSQDYRYYMSKCDTAYGLSSYSEALFFAKKAEEAARTGQPGVNTSQYAYIATTYMGWCYETLGDSLTAADYWYKKGIAIFNNIGDTTSTFYGESIVNYGNYCNNIGRYAEAEPLFLKAAALFKKNVDKQDDYGGALNNLGNLYTYKGDYAKAQAIYLDLLQLVGKDIADPKNRYRATLFINLFNTYTNTGNLYQALNYVKKAFAICEKNIASQREQFLLSLSSLGKLYTEAGLTDSAAAVFKRANENLGPLRSTQLHALILNSESLLAQKRNNYAGAANLCSQALSIMEKLGLKNQPYYGIRFNLGHIYLLQKKYVEAYSVFTTSIGLIRGSGLEYSTVLQQSYQGLCEALVFMGHDKDAGDSLLKLSHIIFDAMRKNFPGMSEQDQLEYIKTLDSYFDILCTFIVKTKAPGNKLITEAFALELQRKNLVLYNKLQFLNQARNSSDTALQIVLSNWLGNRQLLSKQYSLKHKERLLDTDSLENVCDILEKKISAMGGVLPGRDATSSPIALLKSKANAEATIDFIRFNYKLPGNANDSALYAAFVVISGDTLPKFVLLCSEAKLLALLKDGNGKFIASDKLTKKIYEQNSPSANLLYRLLWKPLESSLVKIDTVYYATSGLINNIALDAIHSPDGYLLEKFTMRRFSSLLNAASKQTQLANPTVVNLWGNINYNKVIYADGQLNKVHQPQKIGGPKAKTKFNQLDTATLPVLKEMFASRHLTVSNFENTNASEDGFITTANTATGVLHIDTHGFYMPFNNKGVVSPLPEDFIAANTNPLFRCGLAFSGANNYWATGETDNKHGDGILTGYEVAGLNLRNIQLVTLSACETGLGDVTGSEGNLGLLRAFKIAGAQNVLVSLWPVQNKKTEELITLFYKNWLSGKPIHDAFKSAENTMRKKYGIPYYWAGFVLVE